MGRTEVAPIPTDLEVAGAGIRYRFGAFPFSSRPRSTVSASVRARYKDPDHDDNVWFLQSGMRKLRRSVGRRLSDAIGPYGRADAKNGGKANGPTPTISIPIPTSAFPPKSRTTITNCSASNRCWPAVTPKTPRPNPVSSTTIAPYVPRIGKCARLYVIEATAKPLSWHQKLGSRGVLIPRRVLYIDSEGWFITASDQYDGEGKLWKTIATFNTYRRPPGEGRASRDLSL